MTGDRVFTELLFVGQEFLLIQIHDWNKSFYLVTFCWVGAFTYSNPELHRVTFFLHEFLLIQIHYWSQCFY